MIVGGQQRFLMDNNSYLVGVLAIADEVIE